MTSESVSVVLATFNGARFVGEQLASIAAQARPPDEIVVCDDGSTDATLEVVHEQPLDIRSRLRILPNSGHLGAVKNFERGISAANGEIIVLSDQDDRWLPNRLSQINAWAELNPEAGGLFHDGWIIDGDGLRTGRRLWDATGFGPRSQRAFARGDQLRALLRSNVVTGATLAFRSWRRSTLLPLSEDGWHDLWIAAILSATSELTALPQPLIEYRVHGGNAAGLRPTKRRHRTTSGAERAAGIAREIRQMAALRQRLTDLGAPTHHRETVAGRLALLEHRLSLPESRGRRLPHVVAAGGRYHRYGQGIWSMARDIFGE